MKRIAILVGMLALVLAASVPALAEVTQAPTGTSASGNNTNTGGAVTSDGDNAVTCGGNADFNNGGGLQHQPSGQEYESTRGKPGGTPKFSDTPTQSVPCKQADLQSGSSGSGQ